MLKPATEYKDLLIHLLNNTKFTQKYKFFIGQWLADPPYDGLKHEFVSVDNDGQILGYFEYVIFPETKIATSLCAASFTEEATFTFGKDLYTILDNIFCKYNLDKLYFKAITGSPVEKKYDRLVHKYGGNILGYEKGTIELFDRTYAKVKQYRLTKEGWLQCKKNTNKQ